MRRMKNQKRRGAATAELALLLPFLVFLSVIAVDWARIMYFTMCVNTCARSGALWASDAETRMKEPQYTTVTAAATAASPDISPTVTDPATYYTDAGGQSMVEVTVSMQYKTIASFDLRPWLPLYVPKTQTITRKSRMMVSPQNTK